MAIDEKLMKKRKIKTKGVRYWKDKAWKEFSKWVRLRDAWKTTRTKDKVVCYTCGKTYPAFGVGCCQASHIVQGRWNSILFHKQGVQSCCYNCNVNLRGNYVRFENHFIKDYGEVDLKAIKELSLQTVHFTAPELEEIYNKYKKKYEDLEKDIDKQLGI